MADEVKRVENAYKAKASEEDDENLYQVQRAKTTSPLVSSSEWSKAKNQQQATGGAQEDQLSNRDHGQAHDVVGEGDADAENRDNQENVVEGDEVEPHEAKDVDGCDDRDGEEESMRFHTKQQCSPVC